MSDDYKKLNLGGLTSLVTNVKMSCWGNELFFECVYDPTGDRLSYTLVFHDCHNIIWNVYHPEDSKELEADLIGIHLGEHEHQRPAIIHTDIFEISILYGSFSVEKSSVFNEREMVLSQ
ncbi:hypothetical protein BCD67_24620 [Oscillatoriales cyanobacterium USR001]|nr:hypothetical protein BCD67_24620 [Oscillatoriales cyanobacterium USR001]